MNKVFYKMIEVSPYVYMEAYQNSVGLFDSIQKVQVEIKLDRSEEFIKNFVGMVEDIRTSKVELYEAESVKRGDQYMSLNDEIMLETLSYL